ncbi:MAG: hypothetical protein ACLT76_06465 [Clostridium fessum]
MQFGEGAVLYILQMDASGRDKSAQAAQIRRFTVCRQARTLERTCGILKNIQ